MRWKPIILIGILFVGGLLVAGCKTSSPSSPKQGKKPANISSEEYKKIEEAILLDVITVAPNGAGFMTFYGKVTNGSKRPIRRVKVEVVSIAEQKEAETNPMGQKKEEETKPMGVLGQEWVEDLEPGETDTFNIATGFEPGGIPDYEVRPGKIEF